MAMLELTFKPNTDDMREAPPLSIIAALQNVGARVRAFDPEGMEQARKFLDGVEYARDAYDCAEGADVLVIVSEWDPFRALDLGRIRRGLKSPVLVDLRNVYTPDEVRRHGFTYASAGRCAGDRAACSAETHARLPEQWEATASSGAAKLCAAEQPI